MPNKATTVAAVIVASFCAINFAHGASYNTLYSFKTGVRGIYPSGLVALNGKLYGTTSAGGQYGLGTVFSLTTDGRETVLHSFSGSPDGNAPITLMTFDNYLFGVTYSGGADTSDCIEYMGCGAIFGVAPKTGKERVVLSFFSGNSQADPGGSHPGGVADLGGVLYGTVGSAGPYGNGAVFNIQNGVEKIVYEFKGGADGSAPTNLIRIGNALYGTTAVNGADGCTVCGTIFKLTPDGTETVLHAFSSGADGSQPGCLLNGGDELFACVQGGSLGLGKIIRVKLSDGSVSDVYNFKAGQNDGNGPGSLLLVGKTLYGTTSQGGANDDGTIFSLTKAGQETVLYSFEGYGEPAGELATQIGGTLYGFAPNGGSEKELGTVFSYTP